MPQIFLIPPPPSTPPPSGFQVSPSLRCLTSPDPDLDLDRSDLDLRGEVMTRRGGCSAPRVRDRNVSFCAGEDGKERRGEEERREGGDESGGGGGGGGGTRGGGGGEGKEGGRRIGGGEGRREGTREGCEGESEKGGKGTKEAVGEGRKRGERGRGGGGEGGGGGRGREGGGGGRGGGRGEGGGGGLRADKIPQVISRRGSIPDRWGSSLSERDRRPQISIESRIGRRRGSEDMDRLKRDLRYVQFNKEMLRATTASAAGGTRGSVRAGAALAGGGFGRGRGKWGGRGGQVFRSSVSAPSSPLLSACRRPFWKEEQQWEDLKDCRYLRIPARLCCASDDDSGEEVEKEEYITDSD